MKRGEMIDQLVVEMSELMAGITPADDDVEPEEDEEEDGDEA